MTIVFWLDIYYCIIISWTLYYLIMTFVHIPELPWRNCGRLSCSQVPNQFFSIQLPLSVLCYSKLFSILARTNIRSNFHKTKGTIRKISMTLTVFCKILKMWSTFNDWVWESLLVIVSVWRWWWRWWWWRWRWWRWWWWWWVSQEMNGTVRTASASLRTQQEKELVDLRWGATSAKALLRNIGSEFFYLPSSLSMIFLSQR